MPKSNSQQKSTPDARTRHQQVGAKGEEQAALLRVRTGPKALRAVRGSFFKLWESKEKLTGRNTTAGGSQNKGTEKLQRGAAPSPLEVGGRGEGKGANSAPETPTPPTRQTGPVPI